MSIKHCGIDLRIIKDVYNSLFSLSQGLKGIHIPLEKADLSKFIRNGFKVFKFDCLDDVVETIKDEIPGDIFYLDRFESGVIGRKLEIGSPVNSIKDVDWYNLKVGLTYADFLAIDTGSLLLVEDEILTNITSYPEKLYVTVSSSRLLNSFLNSFDIIYNLNRVFENRFLIRIVNAPSRTGDIEKKIVFGAHGPRDVNIFIYNDGIELHHILASYLTLRFYEKEMCIRRYGYTLDHFLNIYKGYKIVME